MDDVRTLAHAERRRTWARRRVSLILMRRRTRPVGQAFGDLTRAAELARRATIEMATTAEVEVIWNAAGR